jgi:hypothetical protein
MERIIEESDVQGRAMSWETLAYEAGVEDVSSRTIQRTMGRLDYHKCITCRKAWVSRHIARERVEYLKLMLSRYPDKKDWEIVRVSDEVHFSLGPQGRLMIIRKPGERYCVNCIQEIDEPSKKDVIEKRRAHAWGAIGYNFKSELYFYRIPTNTNGKMTARRYMPKARKSHF